MTDQKKQRGMTAARATIVAAIIGGVFALVAAFISRDQHTELKPEQLYSVIVSSWKPNEKHRAIKMADRLASNGYNAEVYESSNGYLAVTVYSFGDYERALVAKKRAIVDNQITEFPRLVTKGLILKIYTGQSTSNQYYLAVCSCNSFKKVGYYLSHFSNLNPTCRVEVFQSLNGKYAITIDGPFTFDEGTKIKNKLIQKKRIPKDSFLIHESKISEI